ncbi:flagellar hook-basal body complex protein [Clostridium sp. KNHs214]|uniref:flagellar hook-basal body complex protein n=1 Tax=Clostridium sp. KNHs214 TaxID=1540257 RepID=UPI00054EE3B3|nr:flagellar hook-basal body complex protein [Clostridium sp. KNHs214]
MLRMFWNSRTAMNSMQNKLEIISNNMTNVSTVGYKKVNVGFQDLLQESLDRKGYPVSRGSRNLQVGTGVRNTGIIRSKGEGVLNQTGNKTDFAIDGQGFFKVYLQDNSVAYTRNGSFQVNTEGKLVDGSGNLVSITDENGRELNGSIRLTRDNFAVSEKGEVYVNLGDGKSTKIGNIGVYYAVGDDAFKSVGENLYVPSNGNIEILKSNDNDVLQGYLELSNVRMEEEMSDLIMTQRAFQLNSSALRTADEMWGMANNLKK